MSSVSSNSNVEGHEPVHTDFPPVSDETAWGASVLDDPFTGLGPASREFLAGFVRRPLGTGDGTVSADPIQQGVVVTDTPQEAAGILPRKPTDPPSGGGQVMYAAAEA